MGFPTWTLTLGAMRDEGVIVSAHCRGSCRQFRRIDLDALIAKVGPDYSLINRRCDCRLFEGCLGYNVFKYSTGTWNYPLYDDDHDAWWCGMAPKPPRRQR